MATTTDYLTQLQKDKQTLVDNLVSKGVNATSDETFTSLVPKVAEITSGGAELEITDASYLFYNGTRTNQINEILPLCKNVTKANQMFNNSSSLTKIDLTGFNASKITSMESMFNQCERLTELNLEGFDCSSCTNINYMFQYCKRITRLDISSIAETFADNGYRSYLFSGCQALKTLIINSQKVFSLSGASMLNNTPIASGTGYVYVPDDLVETYKSATNWSTYANQIKGISELEEV